MTLLILLLSSLTSFANAADAITPETTPAATPQASAAPVAAPEISIPATAAVLPAGPTVKDKANEYAVRTTIETCTPNEPKNCVIDTMITAKQLINQDLVWERRIYFQNYELDKPIDKQAIGVKSLKIVRKKILTVTNTRGDSYDLEISHGHMKKPKDAREYSK
ncbi:hypothetical protein BH10BDE1_BH10BDE1_00370 [soil metagenome]